MPSWVTAAIVACALLRGDHNIPVANRDEIANAEAVAFMAAVQPHLPLDLLLGVGRVESRFNPMGSQLDRDHGVFGVLQLLNPHLRCWGRPQRTEWWSWTRGTRHHRRRHVHHVRFVRHDDPAACTPAQTAARAILFDPAENIRRGALLLERRYAQVHAGRHSARVYAAWPGAYWHGSVPRRNQRRVMRQFFGYAGRVSGASRQMHHQLEQCRDEDQR
jgi:hypothetical protein